MESQRQQLRSWLGSGKTITQPEAMREMLIGRLASRINELRNEGLPVDSKFIPYKRADGKIVQIKKYYLNNETTN